jgi:DNA-directed RNA polymerase beta subunit/intein/homing endonuclease
MLNPFEIFDSSIAPSEGHFTDLGKQLRHLSPPELTCDPESKVLRRFIDKYGFSKIIIATYDHWINTVLPNQIQARTIPGRDGVYQFSDIKVEKPEVTFSRHPDRRAYPRFAQERGFSYCGDVKATITFIPTIPGLVSREAPIRKTLFKIPIMLGSEACWLRDLTDTQKIEIGECPDDPLGYFIIEGTPKVITIQEKLRIYLNLTFLDNDGNIETRMTCSSPSGTTVTSVKVGKKWQTLKIGMQHLRRDKHLPLYMGALISKIHPTHLSQITSDMIIRIYDEFTNDVLKMCSPDHREQVFMALQPSYRKSVGYSFSMETIINYIARKRNITIPQDENKLTEIYTTIYNDVINDMFSHVPVYIKSSNLALMSAITIRFLLGLRTPDDRDSWGNKRLDSGAKSMEQLFNGIWNEALRRAGLQLKTSAASLDEWGWITDNFIKAFQANGWGVTGGYSRENITDTLKRDTPMAIYSQTGRINTPSARKAKQTSIRMIQPTQIGYCCVTGDTDISNGVDSVKIINMKDGDRVNTFDITTHSISTSTIKNYFSKVPEAVHSITTLSGRNVKASPDHPFLAWRSGNAQWIQASDIRADDYLMVKHYQVPLPNADSGVGTKLFIPIELVKPCYQAELICLGLIGCEVSEEKTAILARILGINWSDGCLSKSGRTWNLVVSLGEQEDVDAYVADVVALGFTPPSSRFTTSVHPKNQSVMSVFSVSKCGPLPFLMELLGMPCGKKSTQHSPGVPSWIMKASPHVKREFLSGFQGGDGSRIAMYGSGRRKGAYLDITQQTCKPEFDASFSVFMEQLQFLFGEFGIETSPRIGDRKDRQFPEGIHFHYLYISQNIENIDRYASIIGYRYCNEKTRTSALPIEYIRYRMNTYRKKCVMWNTARRLFESGKTRGEIAKIMGVPAKKVYAMAPTKGYPEKIHMIDVKSLTYDEFCSKVSYFMGHVMVPVESNDMVEIEPVYDFTTVSDAHTFYANGVVVHNCTQESPEGEALGLLKNLALTTVISMERNPAEGIYSVIYSILSSQTPPTLELIIDTAMKIPSPVNLSENPLSSLIQQMLSAQTGPVDRPLYPFESLISFFSKEGWIPVAIGGALYFWTAPAPQDAPKDILGRPRPLLEQILLACRRRKLLPADSCIFFNTNDNVLEYFCEGGRPCRPLFIVDEDGHLKIDKLNMWEASCDELMQNGCVEFVDAREQEYTMLAMNTNQVRDRIKRKEALARILPVTDEVSISTVEIARKALETAQRNVEEVGIDVGRVLLSYYAAVEKSGRGALDMKDFEISINRAITVYYQAFVSTIIGQYLSNNESVDLNVALSQAKNYASRFVHEIIDVHKRKYSIDASKLPSVVVKDTLTPSIIREYKLDLDINLVLRTVVDQLKTESTALSKKIPFIHSEIDPVAIAGVAGSLAPQPNCGQGPRATYQASMCKQALGFYHYNHHLKFDTSFKVMMNPSRPIFETIVAQPAGLNSAPTGTTAICAFLAMADNNEDAIVVKKEFIESRNLDITKYMTTKINIQSNSGETIERPTPNRGESEGRYSALNSRGYPKLDAYIGQNDCIIGKVKRVNGNVVNTSVYAGIGQNGYVDRVLITQFNSRELLIKVKLRQTRKQITGDKVASRYAQKGTISRIVPEKHLPAIMGGRNDGVVPDFFLNPHGIASRMVVNNLKEMKSSLASLYTGERVDATCFHAFDFDGWSRKMLAAKLPEHGDVNMIWPDGNVIRNIFVAPCYYQCLRHHVLDKFQMRARGSIKPLTHQPVSGRENEGGLRVGEMERDGLISHSATGLVLERLMKVSDAYKAPFCRVCGNLAIIDVETKQFICRVCGKIRQSEPGQMKDIQEQFVVKTIPYVLKLMFNMLQALGLNVTLRFSNPDTRLPADDPDSKFLEALV